VQTVADIDGLIFDSLVDATRVGDPNTWRYKVLMALADAGENGATDNELTELLQAPGGQNNLRPRRIELVESGYVTDSGRKRRTSSGSQAGVWRLSNSDRPTLTPAFTQQDCQLAGQVAAAAAGGQALSQIDREEGERLRARFALLGRRARRAAADLGIPVEVDIERPGPIALTVWRSESDRARFHVSASLDENGLHLAVQIGAADSGDPAADARGQRFRAELASLTDEATTPVGTLLEQGWGLSTASSAGETTFDSTRDWLKALVDEPTTSGRISRTLDPAAVEQAGAGVADQLSQLLREVLPVDSAAEAAMRDPVQALVNGLLWDEDRARNLIALTRRARQLLFAGPPGTGKTLAARILADALADESRIKLVQFHPTYAYEDFVEGIRPVMDEQSADGQGDTEGDNQEQEESTAGLRYRIRPGVFKQIVKAAQSAPGEAAHFLIIDEINRANLPRVLGELLFALEYRGPENEVELAYSTDAFYVPENLWVIGTMNTADRSVALLDAAMRRRFKEVRFDVDYDVVRRWHERNTSADLGTEAAARLKRLNAEVIELLDDDRAIGHSFLIRRDLADVGFEVVWNEDLEPVLRDHLLGRTDDLPALREAFLGSL
jgi:5-methylcytosine-specific restriction protein B